MTRSDRREPPADGHQDRLQAARGLTAVLRDRRTLDQFERGQTLTPLATEMLYGSCRYYRPLSALLQPMLQRPLRKKDQDVWSLMIVGAYQLRHMRVPDHAAINATVAASKRLKKPWASGLVNAILRNLQRGSAAASENKIAAASGKKSAAASGNKTTAASEQETEPALPPALANSLQQHYGDNAPPLAAALLGRAPMALRANSARQPAASYAKTLAAQGISFRRGSAPETLILETPQPAESLPGYREGRVSVQDAGAQLAGLALTQLGGAPPRRMLDACAAPGGKLFHFVEQHPETAVTAVEQSQPRLEYLKAEAERLGHETGPSLQIVLGDATTRDWWDGEPFDLILLDAPCSGSGTLRRHPDIALLRDFDDLAADLALQDQLLANLSGMLAPDGRLLYVTCSVLPEENDQRIAALLRGTDDRRLVPIPLNLPTGAATEFGWQLLPTDADTDGFYFAGLKH